jgi:Tol biopolymer transport system component
MNVDGSHERRLTKGRSGSPTWSPDGSRIAFDAGGGIYVSNSDGSGRRPLMTDRSTEMPLGSTTNVYAQAPAWSPDGRWIAFLMNYDLYVIAPNGSRQRRLTWNHEADVLRLAWSPDGQRIAFESWRERVAPGRWRDRLPEIYVINADGTRLRKLTRNDDLDSDPSWSPDGKRIAFARLNGGWDSCEADKWEDCNVDIYVMDADGSDQHRLTSNPKLDAEPSWSSGT